MFYPEFTGDPDCCKEQGFLWLVDNKYYNAEILLQYGCFNDSGKVDAKVEDYEAVVIVLDCTDKSNASLSNITFLINAILVGSI